MQEADKGGVAMAVTFPQRQVARAVHADFVKWTHALTPYLVAELAARGITDVYFDGHERIDTTSLRRPDVQTLTAARAKCLGAAGMVVLEVSKTSNKLQGFWVLKASEACASVAVHLLAHRPRILLVAFFYPIVDRFEGSSSVITPPFIRVKL